MDAASRIVAYFRACSEGTAAEIAQHFTDGAIIWDTNVAAFRGAEQIGARWVKVRERWQGAVWGMDSCVAAGDQAAIEWWMTGTDPRTGRAFIFRGSEHYRFVDTRIDEIRQYWTFDPAKLDTGLVGYSYRS